MLYVMRALYQRIKNRIGCRYFSLFLIISRYFRYFLQELLVLA